MCASYNSLLTRIFVSKYIRKTKTAVFYGFSWLVLQHMELQVSVKRSLKWHFAINMARNERGFNKFSIIGSYQTYVKPKNNKSIEGKDTMSSMPATFMCPRLFSSMAAFATNLSH